MAPGGGVGGLWAALAGWTPPGLAGYPPVTDAWEPCLLEKPRTNSGSQFKWGLRVAGIKLPPMKDFQGVGTLHIEDYVGFGDWSEPKSPGVPSRQRLLGTGHSPAVQVRGARDLHAGSYREGLGHRSRLVRLPGVLPNSKP